MNKEELKNKIKESLGDRVSDNLEILDKGDSKFKFTCHGCGSCCTSNASEQIIMSPLDIYNAAKELKVKPIDVLNNYCETYIGSDSNFPVIRLKANRVHTPYGELTYCPLINNGKCSIHNGKPSICRLYPLGRMTYSDVNNKEKGEIIYFLQETDCSKRYKDINKETHTIDEWIRNREDEEYMMRKTQHVLIDIYREFDFKKFIEDSADIQKTNKETADHRMKNLNDFFNFIVSEYYLNYDTNKDFKLQIEENSKKFELILDIFKKAYNC